MIMVVIYIVALLALCYVLSRATDVLVQGITQLSENTSFESSGLTAVFVALATSLPELFVGVSGALSGDQQLSLGVVVGSNIANISIIIGFAALIAGSVKARDEVYARDIAYSLLVGCLPMVLLWDGRLSRFDGMILVLVYISFNVLTLRRRRKERLDQVEKEYYGDSSMRHRILSFIGKKDVEQGLGRLVVGSALLIVCADVVVRLAEIIAMEMGVPMLLVGLFMVSVGTSLPELAFELKTVARREYLMAFGNIIGSTVVNSSLVIGASVVLMPVVLMDHAMESYLVSVVGFVVISLAFWLMTYTKKQLERWEGAVLVMLYVVFALVQMRLA